jgi:hypothetical protein
MKKRKLSPLPTLGTARLLRPPAPVDSDDTTAAQRIYWTLQTSRARDRLGVARRDYLQAFGRPYDDPDINRDYLEHIENYFGYARAYTLRPANVAIPAPVALAFYLRHVAEGRKGSLPKTLALDLQDDAQMRAVRRRAAKYKREGYPEVPTVYDRGKKVRGREIVRRHVPADGAQLLAVEHVYNHWRRGKRENRLNVDQMLERLRKPEKYESWEPRGIDLL